MNSKRREKKQRKEDNEDVSDEEMVFDPESEPDPEHEDDLHSDATTESGKTLKRKKKTHTQRAKSGVLQSAKNPLGLTEEQVLNRLNNGDYHLGPVPEGEISNAPYWNDSMWFIFDDSEKVNTIFVHLNTYLNVELSIQ